MGKRIVLLLIAITMVVIIGGYFGLQYFIDKHDIDRDAAPADASPAPVEVVSSRNILYKNNNTAASCDNITDHPAPVNRNSYRIY